MLILNMGLYTHWLSHTKRPEVLFKYQTDFITCGLLPLMEDGTLAYFWYNDVYLGLQIDVDKKEVCIISLNGETIMDVNRKSIWMEVLISLFSIEWQFRYKQNNYLSEADVRSIQRICQDNPMEEKHIWVTILDPMTPYDNE